MLERLIVVCASDVVLPGGVEGITGVRSRT